MARLLRDNRPVQRPRPRGRWSIVTPSERETRAAGPLGVSLLTDKKVTKVTDESFGLALGERGRQEATVAT